MSDLREQLAQRLFEVGCAADETEDFRWNCRDEVQAALADECLRQMEYAWAQGYTAAECDQTSAIYEHGYFDRQIRKESSALFVEGKPVPYALILAPDGWKS